MNLLVETIFTVLAVSSAFADKKWDIDWSTVIPMTETPGFWDGRDTKLAHNHRDEAKSGRIVGGTLLGKNHSRPFQAALLVRVNSNYLIGLCGGSVVTYKAILTAAHCMTCKRNLFGWLNY